MTDDREIYLTAVCVFTVVMAGWGWRSAAGLLASVVAGLTTLVTGLCIKAALY